jgi:hypothetical protein
METINKNNNENTKNLLITSMQQQKQQDTPTINHGQTYQYNNNIIGSLKIIGKIALVDQ